MPFRLAALLLALLLAAAGCNRLQPQAQPTAQAQDEPLGPPVAKIDAMDLYWAFKDKPIEAEAKYMGKVFEISGMPHYLTGSTDEIEILTSAPKVDDVATILCKINQNKKKQFIGLSDMSRYAFRGRVKEFKKEHRTSSGFQVVIVSCEVLHKERWDEKSKAWVPD